MDLLTIFLAFAAAVSSTARASEVRYMEKGVEKAAVISHQADHAWKKFEKVCLWRGAVRLGCGKIIFAHRNGAIMEWTKLYAEADLGDEVKAEGIANGAPARDMSDLLAEPTTWWEDLIPLYRHLEAAHRSCGSIQCPTVREPAKVKP